MYYVRLYFEIMGNHLSSKLQYRFTFIIQLITYGLMPLIDLSVLFIYFNSFNSLAGWNAWEIAIIYCITSSGFGLTETFARGFDTFPYLVQNGNFDRMLLRPLNSVFQVMTNDFPFVRLIKVVYGVLFLGIACIKLQLEVTLGTILVMVLSILSCACMFTGLFVIMGAVSFITVSPLGIFHLFTDGTREIGRYPISAYPKWFARFYIFVIPVGCVTYFPVLYILRKSDEIFHVGRNMQVLYAFSGYIFLGISFVIWNLFKDYYLSTGN